MKHSNLKTALHQNLIVSNSNSSILTAGFFFSSRDVVKKQSHIVEWKRKKKKWNYVWMDGRRREEVETWKHKSIKKTQFLDLELSFFSSSVSLRFFFHNMLYNRLYITFLYHRWWSETVFFFFCVSISESCFCLVTELAKQLWKCNNFLCS